MSGSQGAGRSGRHDGRRGRRLPRRTAERLLDGRDSGTDDPRTAGLARLLAAAAQPLPGRPEGEGAALAAFRAAVAARSADGSAPVPPAGADRPDLAAEHRHATRRKRSVRVLIGGAVAACALSGVALAAQTGAFPHPFGTHHPGTTAPLTTADRAGASRTDPDRSSGPAGGTDPSAAGTPSGNVPLPSTPGTSSSPHQSDPTSTKGLCAAYVKADGKGKTLDPSDLERLSRAAGGAGQIAAYCARLTGTAGSGEHTLGPSTPAKPSAPTVPTAPARQPDPATKPSASPSPAHTTPAHTAGGGEGR